MKNNELSDVNRAEFEQFMAYRFGDCIDRRRCKNGDGNDYMSSDMGIARIVWQHMQQKLDAVVAENLMARQRHHFIRALGISIIEHSGGRMDWRGAIQDATELVASINAVYADTPASDAILNAVRAEGVEMLTSKLQQLIDEGNFEGDEIGVIAGAVYTGADIANQLRADAAKDGEHE